MKTGKKIVSIFMVFVMTFLLGSTLPIEKSKVYAASYSAEDVKNVADIIDNYLEKAGDDIGAFLKNDFGYSGAVVKEALQTLIIKYGGYKKLVLRYKERTGIDYTKSLKKVLGNLDAKGGKISKMYVVSIEEQLYSGKAIKPVPVIMDGGYQLVKSKDYKVTYSNNKKTGIAKITLSGLGKYSGKVDKTFTIVAVRKSDIAKPWLDMVENVGDNTFLTISGLYEDAKYDGVQILRSEKENGKYSMIKTIKRNGLLAYIDKDTKGKSYYYKVRAYVEAQGKKWTGEERILKASKTSSEWYVNSEGYVRVFKDGGGVASEFKFKVYDLNLKHEWYCDWGVTDTEEDMSYTINQDGSQETKTTKVNYIASPPYNYLENGQSIEVGIYYDQKQFYYIWKQSGGDDGFAFERFYTRIK